MNTIKQKRRISMVLALSLTLLLSNVLIGCSIKGKAVDIAGQNASAASKDTDTKSGSAASKETTAIPSSPIPFPQRRIGQYVNASNPTVTIDITRIADRTVEFTLQDLRADSGETTVRSNDPASVITTEHAVGQIVDKNTVQYKDDNYDILLVWHPYKKSNGPRYSDPGLIGYIEIDGVFPEDSSIWSKNTVYYADDCKILHVS